MKHLIIALGLFFLAALPGTTHAQQQLSVDNPVFTFDSVPEGTHVSHTFKIRNIGNAPLMIEKVMPP